MKGLLESGGGEKELGNMHTCFKGGRWGSVEFQGPYCKQMTPHFLPFQPEIVTFLGFMAFESPTVAKSWTLAKKKTESLHVLLGILQEAIVIIGL